MNLTRIRPDPVEPTPCRTRRPELRIADVSIHPDPPGPLVRAAFDRRGVRPGQRFGAIGPESGDLLTTDRVGLDEQC